MENIVSSFLQFGTIILGCAVFIATLLVRRFVETALPSVKKQADANDPKASYKTTFSRWWNEVILYALPIVIGCIFGLINASFMFSADMTSLSGRCIFGGVVGHLSGFVYKLVKKAIIKKVGVSEADLMKE